MLEAGEGVRNCSLSLLVEWESPREKTREGAKAKEAGKGRIETIDTFHFIHSGIQAIYTKIEKK